MTERSEPSKPSNEATGLSMLEDLRTRQGRAGPFRDQAATAFLLAAILEELKALNANLTNANVPK